MSQDAERWWTRWSSIVGDNVRHGCPGTSIALRSMAQFISEVRAEVRAQVLADYAATEQKAREDERAKVANWLARNGYPGYGQLVREKAHYSKEPLLDHGMNESEVAPKVTFAWSGDRAQEIGRPSREAEKPAPPRSVMLVTGNPDIDMKISQRFGALETELAELKRRLLAGKPCKDCDGLGFHHEATRCSNCAGSGRS